MHDTSPPLNHVFVDFENVHEVDLSVLGAKAVSFTFLLGAKQTRLEVGLVERLLAHSASIELVRLASSGRNALDFALAYYLGRAVHSNPAAYFHIVSKDKGFDPLVEHLRSRHFHVRRHDSFATLTFSGPSRAATTAKAAPAAKAPVDAKEDSLTRVVERLRGNVGNRPKRKRTLLSHLKSQLGKEASDDDAAKLLEKLIADGHVSIGEKDAVTYRA